MAEKSIFKCGKKELLELKEILEKYHEYEKRISEIIKKEEKQLQFNEERKKEIDQAMMAKEAELRKDIAKPFDITITKYMTRKEELLAQKEVKRNEAIEVHIEQEKQNLSHEGNHYKRELKKIVEEEGLPWICMTKLFFAFFYPKTLSDAMVLVVSLITLLLFLPLSIFYLFFPNGGRLELTSVYLFIVVLFFIVYTLINNTIKEKHMNAFQRMNECRVDVDKTAKGIREIIQKVREMSDEELICDVYTKEYLTKVNEELETLNTEIVAETAKKDAAIREFDEDTAARLEREQKFHDLYQKEMKRRADILADIRSVREVEERNLTYIEQLMEKFKPLEELGINIFDERIVDELLGYLRNREAKTIGGAIEQRNKVNT